MPEKPIKILLVSPFTSASGSAIRFWNLALQFKANGYGVVYIDRYASSRGPLYSTNGIVYRPSRSISPLVLDIVLSTLFNLFMLLRHFDCRVYYALKPAPNNCIPALIARMLGKKVILDIDDLDYEYYRPGLKRIVAGFFFRLFPRFFPLVTCHTKNLMTFCEQTLRIPRTSLYFLSQGVSQEFFQINVRESRPLNKSILYAATLGITSEFDDLLPALDRLCTSHLDAKITVAGDGARRPVFEQNVKKLGLNRAVTFLGQVPHERFPEIMASHAIGINYMRPTRVNECRAILKIREYLACGLHVVCNNCGDAALFGSVAFVEDNIERMERRLDELLSRPLEKNITGREFVLRHFSWPAIVRDFLAEIKSRKVLQ